MFDLAWSEIALIAVVAVVVIGPKDLPDAVRGVARGIQKLRRMAGEFQGHLDEVVRDLAEHGFMPSFCTGCYRLGRVGAERARARSGRLSPPGRPP